MLRLGIIAAGSCTVLLLVGCSGNKPNADTPAEIPATAPPDPTASTSDGDGASPANADHGTLEPLQLMEPTSSESKPAAAVETSAGSFPIEPSAPIAVRIADRRPELNAARLQASGILKLESKRLILLTDLSLEEVAGLPEMADQLFDHLESHFGKLPPAVDGSEFQVTGCIIGDVAKFKTTGLMPEPGFGFKYGRHREYQFWMYAPKTEYYRRHLMLHEFTHCFMTCETTMLDIPPRWYVEGMAEFFATHRLAANGSAEFGILPEEYTGYEGWGRISAIDRMYQRQHKPTVSPEGFAVEPFEAVIRDVVFSESESDYCKWWAISWLLQANPAYQSTVDLLKPMRRRDEFMAAEKTLRQQLGQRLEVDWLLVAETLEQGFDIARSFPLHSNAAIDVSSLPFSIEIQSDRDWQDTGVRLKAGESVSVTCEGRYSVNEPAEKWVSEPQGITVDYVRGFPIGAVVACLVSSDGQAITHRFAIGREATIEATKDVAVWMQVNDSCNSRSNNSGSVKVSFLRQ